MEARGVFSSWEASETKRRADLFGGLKAVGELVELLRQMGQLVLPRRLEPVAVLPLAHDADGPQQGPDAGGEHFGEERN